MSKQWFHSWFNSPYYHMLYQQRDAAEAQGLIQHLQKYLHLPSGSRVLDVGCGRGRHACLLHKSGYQVTGIDLSVANITCAMQHQSAGIQFFAHDMRYLYYPAYFNVVVNLFTSFGYFKTTEEHILVLKNMHACLLPGGLMVLDYLNSKLVARNLRNEETKSIDGVVFHLSKSIEGDRVIKNIVLQDEQHTEKFQEQVNLFTPDDFRQMFAQSGFEIVNTFGNYRLDSFDVNTSERLIFICKKAND